MASTSQAEGSAYAKAREHLVHSRKGEGQFWSKKNKGTLGVAPRDEAGLGRMSGGMEEMLDFILGCMGGSGCGHMTRSAFCQEHFGF